MLLLVSMLRRKRKKSGEGISSELGSPLPSVGSASAK
jgi:hypothetical protein